MMSSRMMNRVIFRTAWLLAASAACGARSEIDLSTTTTPSDAGYVPATDAVAPPRDATTFADAAPHRDAARLPDATTTTDAASHDASDGAPSSVRDAGVDHESGGPVDAAPDSPAPDASADQSSPPLIAPRQISPLSTSRVTRRAPTLRWVYPSDSGITDATVDLCLDRACAMPIGAPVHVTGTSYAPTTNLPIGVVYWRLHPSRNSAVTSPTWQFTVGERNAPVDSSWGTTLDVNGDGYADIVVGAAGTSTDPFEAYVYLGSATGLTETPAATYIGPPGSGGAVSVTSAGDVNGDGFADLLVSSIDGDYVYLGGPSGLASVPSALLTNPRGTSGAFGVPATSLGDVNGDGYADVVVGSIADPSLGAVQVVVYVYVYLGSATGLTTTPATTISIPLVPQGPFNPDPTGFGFLAFASAGDLNGDGYGDLVVTAGAIGEGYLGGRTVVYMGGATGLATMPATALTGLGDVFEQSVGGAGDVNGDGYADLVIGEDVFSASTGFYATSAEIFLGSAAGLETSASATLSPLTPGDQGPDVLTSAGDVNGDGYADVVFGVSFLANAYVYLGEATGVAATPASTFTGPPESSFAASVASAGDINGDGFADLVIGVPGSSTPGGAAMVYLGSAAGLAATPAVTLVAPGDGGAGFGSSVFGATN